MERRIVGYRMTVSETIMTIDSSSCCGCTHYFDGFLCRLSKADCANVTTIRQTTSALVLAEEEQRREVQYQDRQT